MKKLLLLLIIPFLSFGQNRFEIAEIPNKYLITNPNFEIRNGKYFNLIYEKDADSPFTGELKIPLQHEGFRLTGRCINGIKTGLWKIYSDTIYKKLIITESPILRDNKKAEQIAKKRNIVAGQVFSYKNGELEITVELQKSGKHISTAYFNYTLMYTALGRWEIDEKNLNVHIWDESSSLPELGEDRWFKISNTNLILEDQVYKRKENPYTGETWQESLEASKYSGEYELIEVLKTFQDTDVIHQLKYDSNGLLIEYFNPKNNCLFKFNNDNTKSINCNKYFFDYDEYGLIIGHGTKKYNNKTPTGFCLMSEKNNTSIVLANYFDKTGLSRYPSFYRFFSASSEKEHQSYGASGVLTANFKTTKSGIIKEGFFNLYNTTQLRTKVEISTLKETREKYKENRRFLSYNIIHTMYDRFDNMLFQIQSDERGLYYSYKEYFENGNIKKELRFKKDKDFLLKSMQGVDDGSNNWYSILMRNILADGYQLFHKKQSVYHENGEVKFSVTFKGKSIKEINKNDRDKNQKYYVFNDRYFTYLGDGYEYSDRGKKIRKIYWDQYGRICDENGKILDDNILNINVNLILEEYLK